MSIRVDSTKKVPGHSSSWFCFVCFYYSSKHGLIALILEVEKAPGIIYGTVLSFFYRSFSSAIVHTATFNYSKIKIILGLLKTIYPKAKGGNIPLCIRCVHL